MTARRAEEIFATRSVPVSALENASCTETSRRCTVTGARPSRTPLVYIMLNEAAMAVEEGVVRSPRDGDIGAIFGIGYPPFRGGPLRYIDDLGAVNVVDTLRQLANAYGDRFTPAATLVSMAENARRFYP